MSAAPVLVHASRAHFHASLALASGNAISDYTLVYETHGELDQDGGNAVLVCHALNASHHVSGQDQQERAGWWDAMVGPGRPVDTGRFFVICINNLGSCFGSTGPASAHPADGEPWGARFPQLCVEDWVDAQARLLDRLNIRTLAAVIGGSLGGMQALSWANRYPERVRHCVAIATCARLSAQNLGFNEVARRAIESDPDFHAGDYLRHGTMPRAGLAVARMLGHLTYVSAQALDQRFGRRRSAGGIAARESAEFDVARALRRQADAFCDSYDANTYLLVTRALDRFDLADPQGDLARGLAPATARFLLVSFTSDWRFPSSRSIELADALRRAGRDVELRDLDAPNGHDAFLQEYAAYHAVVRNYFDCIETAIEAQGVIA